MKIFEPYTIGGLTLPNRIVLPPMCMYQSPGKGIAADHHLVHYASRAIGGTGLLILEATGVAPEGRISDRCLGLWEDRQVPPLARIVRECKTHGAKVGIQLNHAGRKSTAKAREIYAPSAIAFNEDYRLPAEMSLEEIERVIGDFRSAADRAARAGFDLLEIHGAHGYLIHEFLSPLSNKREDDYGGSTKNRSRFLERVLSAVREVWPEGRPLGLRVSATDYLKGGLDVEETIRILEQVKGLLDVVHVSTGGLLQAPIRTYPAYQVEHARAVREALGLPVIAVGLIRTGELAEEILENSRADLVAVGREQLRNPYWVLHAAQKAGVAYAYPECYLDGFFRRR